MNTNIRFSKSDLITAAGVAMRPLEIDDKGGLFERLGQPGITERLSHEELSDLLRRPDTSYVAGYFDRAVQDLRSRKPSDVINVRIPRKMGIDSTASWAVIPRLGQSGRLVHGVRPDPTGQAVSW